MKYTTCALFVLLAALLLPEARAQTTNAVDRINFGSPSSEAAHAFNPGGGTPAPAGTGAFGQTFRQPYGASSTLTPQSELVFTLQCSSTLQNYLTVKLWGSDTQPQYLYLSGSTGIGSIDANGGPPPFPNRFHYETVPVPITLTKGKTSVQITLYPGGADTAKPARPIYSAFSHTDPRFVPDPADATGSKQAQDGYRNPAALTIAQVTALLQASRQAIYGSGGYYSQMLARQVMPGTAGAPPETVGLDLWGSVSRFSGTPDQWRDQIGGGEHGPGYSTVPDEMLSVLWATYALPPFQDASGSTVTGLDHYHDPALLTRLVSCLDGSTFLQSSDGSFNRNANNASGVWQGLTSTPRAAGHPYAGSTARGTGWTLSLEGVDTCTLGTTILNLLNDPTAGPAFRTSLSQSYDADLNGSSMLRAYAYERMLSNSASYLYNVSGGTEAQNLIEELGMYSAQLALAKLQSLYPNSSYTGVGSAAAVTRMQMCLGLVPETGMGGTDPTQYGSGGVGLTNYGITSGGFGEAHGALSCGYDGRYGTILPWLAARFAQLAALDPTVSAPVLQQVQKVARTTADGYDQFISPGENAGFDTGTGQFVNHFTLAQEDFITYRDPYNPNANGGTFTVNGQYLDSDPGDPIQDAYALRSAYLEALYAKSPVINPGGTSSLNYLRDLAAYEATLRSLVGADPATLKPLPGEPSQPNSAFVDVACGATAIYYNGERFYMNANWRSFEYASPQQFGFVSNYARIHDITGTIDRAALVYMPHDSTTVQSDGNLSGALTKGWVARYGPFLVAGNNTNLSSKPASMTVKLPPGTGTALELISKKTYTLGSRVTLSAGQGAAFVLPGAGSTGSGTAPLLADGVYTLSNVGSGLVANDRSNGVRAGTPVEQASATGSLSRKWVLTNLGGNVVRLVNGYSALLLDTASSAAGAAVVQNTNQYGSGQSWQLAASGSRYTLTNTTSGFVLDVPGGSSSPGTGIDTAIGDGTSKQQWQFTPDSLVPNGTYTLANAGSGQVMDKFGPTTDYQRVAQNPPTGGANQQWKIVNLSSSILALSDVADSQYLQVIFGYTSPASQLAGSGNYNGSNAVWQVTPAGNGRLSLVGLGSGLPAEVPGSSTAANTILDIGAPSGSPFQQWTFASLTAVSQNVTTLAGQPVGITLGGHDLNTPAQPVTFSISSPPRHGTLTGTAPNLTYTPSAGFTGTDSFTFTVTNAVSGASAPVGITVVPRATGPTVQINAGGPAVAPFAADVDYSGGSANSTAATIDTSAAHAAPMAVYQTGRYGAFTYTVPGLTAGAGYTVRLHFAETYWNTAGRRVENVVINGAAALTGFDIFAAAGAANKAVVKDFTAAADSGGRITVAVSAASGSPDGNALLAGLEVLPPGTSVSGVVSLQAWEGSPQPLTCTLTPTNGTAGAVTTQTLTPTANGAFTLTGVPAGTYTLGVKGTKWLQKNVSVDTTTGNATLPTTLTLRGGDASGDNQVNGTDYLILRAAYGTAQGASKYNAAADFNGDNQVNGTDYLILRQNYGVTGDN